MADKTRDCPDHHHGTYFAIGAAVFVGLYFVHKFVCPGCPLCKCCKKEEGCCKAEAPA